MSEDAFLLTVAIVFLLIAFGHFVRIKFGMPFLVHRTLEECWVDDLSKAREIATQVTFGVMTSVPLAFIKSTARYPFWV